MMKSDIKEILSRKTSKVLIEDITKLVITSPELFDDLYILTTDEDITISWHALWVCCKISETHPSFFYTKYEELANRAMNEKNASTLRLILNILNHLPTPASINVAFFDFCIQNMISPNNTSACQALLMKIAYKTCHNNHTELLMEIKTILENMDETYYNPAAISAKNTILRKLGKSNRIKS